MKDLIFSLKIVLDRFIVNSTNLGAVTLQRGGREYILDVVQSYTYDDDECESGTTIQCDLEIDEDTFEDCPYDLTIEDLLSDDLEAEFFIDDNGEYFEVESIMLNFDIDGESHSIKVEEE